MKDEILTLNNQIKKVQLESKKKEDEIANKEGAIKKLEQKLVEQDVAQAGVIKKFEKQIS